MEHLCRSSDYGYTRLYVENSTHLRIQQVNAEKNGQIIDEIWIEQNNHGPFCYECYWIFLLFFLLAFKHPKDWLQNEIYYFNTTDQWKSSEQAHSSTNNRKFSFCICPFILHSKIEIWWLFDFFSYLHDNIKGWCVKRYLHKLEVYIMLECWKRKCIP